MVSRHIYCQGGFGFIAMKTWKVTVAKLIGVLFFFVFGGAVQCLLWHHPPEPWYHALERGAPITWIMYIFLAHTVSEHVLRLLSKNDHENNGG